MDRTKIIACVTIIALSGCGANKHAVIVGSKNFTEQVVLGEIIAQHIENRLHLRVRRQLNLGGTLLAQQAMISGGIDLYPEYSGTALAAILKEKFEGDSGAVLARVRAAYEKKFQFTWLDPLGIDNGFAMVVRGEDARSNRLETLADAANVATPWRLGVGYEFEQRADGLAALQKAYGLKLQSSPKTMDLGLLYKAIEQNQVSMIAANATDGPLSKLDLKVLRDDKHAFPPYEVCIVARDEKLNAIAGLREALLELSGKFTNEKMQRLNARVDGDHVPVSQVAAEFLKAAGL